MCKKMCSKYEDDKDDRPIQPVIPVIPVFPDKQPHHRPHHKPHHKPDNSWNGGDSMSPSSCDKDGEVKPYMDYIDLNN